MTESECFQAATVLTLGNGCSILFWSDRWLDGWTIKEIAPLIFASVGSRKRGATVAEALQNHNWVRHITAPLTMQVLLEFDKLFDMVERFSLSDAPDTFTWTLSADRAYSAASAYGAMFLGCSMPLGAKQIWRTAAPPRVCFFFWLVLHGRSWTADRRFRHGLQTSNTCIICDQEVETIDHILLGCYFCRQVWEPWLAKLGVQGVVVLCEEPTMEWWIRSRKLVPKLAHRGFDSLFFLISWMIWKERNARTFGGAAVSPNELQAKIQDEVQAWGLAGFRQLLAIAL